MNQLRDAKAKGKRNVRHFRVPFPRVPVIKEGNAGVNLNSVGRLERRKVYTEYLESTGCTPPSKLGILRRESRDSKVKFNRGIIANMNIFKRLYRNINEENRSDERFLFFFFLI